MSLTKSQLQAGLLLSLRAGVNIILFTIVLPFIATFVVSKLNPPSGASVAHSEARTVSGDLSIARGSIILMIFGTSLLSISFTPSLMVIGKSSKMRPTSTLTSFPLSKAINSLRSPTNYSHPPTGLILYTLGTGFPLVVRSIITTLVVTNQTSTTSDTGRLYAVISVMEGLGTLVAGPTMALAFRWGLRLGENWLGLPFAVATGLFVGIAPVVFVIRA
jgi:hypothetical protein